MPKKHQHRGEENSQDTLTFCSRLAWKGGEYQVLGTKVGALEQPRIKQNMAFCPVGIIGMVTVCTASSLGQHLGEVCRRRRGWDTSWEGSRLGQHALCQGNTAAGWLPQLHQPSGSGMAGKSPVLRGAEGCQKGCCQLSARPAKGDCNSRRRGISDLFLGVLSLRVLLGWPTPFHNVGKEDEKLVSNGLIRY